MRFIIGMAMLAVTIGHAMPAWAQQLTTGTITGIVQDDQGLRMPGVTVEIRNEERNDVRTTVSNEGGLFTMPALPLGKYTLKLALEGFATVERIGIQLRSGEVYNAGTITLSVGALTQSTTVYADSAVVQTANAEKNSVLEERAIELARRPRPRSAEPAADDAGRAGGPEHRLARRDQRRSGAQHQPGCCAAR